MPRGSIVVPLPIGHLAAINAYIQDGRQACDITEDQFARTFDFNARSAFFCSQRAARHMVAQGGGAIVNISSNFAVAGVGVRSVYCAAKAAVDSFTRSFAVEWAPLGVRVNAIAPGTMNTPGYQRARRDAPRMVESVIAATPSGRIAEPREVAALAVFPLSDACAAMTGQVITVDGGQSVPLAALGISRPEPADAAGCRDHVNLNPLSWGFRCS